MWLADNEIHCHIWRDLTRGQSRGAKLIPRTLEFYPGVSGEIRQTDTGKPYLSNSCYQVSISHSGDLAVVILTRSSSVGCDIEYYKPRSFKRISDSYFHANEAVAIDNAACAMPVFYGLWTLKEAYGKAVGTGMSGTLSQDFSDVIENIPGNSSVVEREAISLVHIPNIPGYGFFGGTITPDCSIAIVVETDRPAWTLKCLNHPGVSPG